MALFTRSLHCCRGKRDDAVTQWPQQRRKRRQRRAVRQEDGAHERHAKSRRLCRRNGGEQHVRHSVRVGVHEQRPVCERQRVDGGRHDVHAAATATRRALQN